MTTTKNSLLEKKILEQEKGFSADLGENIGYKRGEKRRSSNFLLTKNWTKTMMLTLLLAGGVSVYNATIGANDQVVKERSSKEIIRVPQPPYRSAIIRVPQPPYRSAIIRVPQPPYRSAIIRVPQPPYRS